MEDETRLPGGNAGGAVRVGATVRRRAGRCTPTIQRLLAHLRAAGLREVPEPLGVDPLGRETVGFLVGETVGDAEPWPAWAIADRTVEQTARLLRRVHDASVGFGDGEELPWRLVDAAVGPGQVVCHNDVAPYNLVCRDGDDLGLIDWDFAAPGDRRVDVAFALWQFAPLHHPELTRRLGWPEDVDRLGRARLFVDRYGLDERSGLSEIVVERMTEVTEWILRLAGEGDPAFARMVEGPDLDDIRSSIAHVRGLADELDRALAG